MEKLDKELFDYLNKINTNNDDILLETINELNKLKVCCKDDLIIKTLDDIIKKINDIITENKKKFELIKNDISEFYKKFEESKINTNLNNKELIFEEGKYIGQVMNGLPEGKGIFYYKNGSRYEGEFKNGKKDGIGIYFYEQEPFKGNRYDGGWKDNKQEGKGLKENGKMEDKEVKEYIIIIMVIDMKEILKIVAWMEKVYIIIIMVKDMKVILEMEKGKEKEFFILIMEIEVSVII